MNMPAFWPVPLAAGCVRRAPPSRWTLSVTIFAISSKFWHTESGTWLQETLQTKDLSLAWWLLHDRHETHITKRNTDGGNGSWDFANQPVGTRR